MCSNVDPISNVETLGGGRGALILALDGCSMRGGEGEGGGIHAGNPLPLIVSSLRQLLSSPRARFRGITRLG